MPKSLNNGSDKKYSLKGPLHNIRIAILVCDGFEEVEMVKPRKFLQKKGATVDLITPNANKVKSWNKTKWGKTYKTDTTLERANPKTYQVLLLPGGVLNPDKLRMNNSAVKFINTFFKQKKLIAAICHAALTLIETKQLKKRKLTSYPSIKTDLINAGANWEDKRVVIDKNLITSRWPHDIPYFNQAILEYLK